MKKTSQKTRILFMFCLTCSSLFAQQHQQIGIDADKQYSEILIQLENDSPENLQRFEPVLLNESGYCTSPLYIIDHQEQVDTFNCTTFEGTILIHDNLITNLHGLAQLTSVDGNLLIYNTQIETLSGLSQLISVGGNLSIDNNDALTDLSGLDSLISVSNGLYVNNNNLLTTTTNSTSLKTIGSDIRIKNNPSLTEILFLSEVASAGGNVEISGNTALADLKGFPKITSIQYDLIISNNSNLLQINALSKLTTVNDNLTITDNLSLNSIKGLMSISSVGGDLKIINNPDLSFCCGIKAVLSSDKVEGDVLIYDNGSGCTETEIKENCYSCNDVVLKTQEEVDQFYCQECSLTVSGENIRNLYGLSEYQGGQILYVRNNPNLTSLDGLDNFMGAGILRIENNPKLTSLDGMTSFRGSGDISITGNSLITNVDVLSPLREVQGFLEISGNAQLKNIDGLSNLNTVYSDLGIRGNAELTDISGLRSLGHANRLWIANNPKLKECCTLFGILIYGGVPGNILRIEDNGEGCSFDEILSNCAPCSGDYTLDTQEKVDGFRCSTVKGSLTIGGDITNIDNLSRITTVLGNLNIDSCSQLGNIDKLSNISFVGKDLTISNNDQLSNIQGLSGISEINGNLKILGNPSLQTVDALSDASLVKGNLEISGNSQLSDCCGLYSLLSTNSIDGKIIIQNNGSGCTENDILKNCSSMSCTGSFTFSSQQQLDTFDCVFIDGSVIVTGTDITNLTGLSKLRSINHDVKILNTSIKDMTGLSNLSYIGGNLSLDNNDQLTGLEGLYPLEALGKDLYINNHNKLSNIKELSHMTYIGGNIRIKYNPLLNECCGLFPLLDKDSIPGSIVIEGNGTTCTQSEILGNCSSCYGNLVINTQEGIDNFNCVNFNGSITIEGADIENLYGLFELRTISGNLTIKSTSLYNLHGLELLNYVGGNLAIRQNERIYNMEGLTKLTCVNGEFFIYDNRNLHNLEGMYNLREIGYIRIYYNPLLERIGNIPNLSNIKKLLAIEGNGQLKDVNGFSVLNHIDGSLGISYNYNISDLSGFSNLTSIGGSLWFSYERSINSFEAFSNLETIGESLSIDVTSASSLNGFSKLKTIGGGFEISSNSNLNGLYGMPKISRIGGNLRLYNNENLNYCCEVLDFIGSGIVLGDIILIHNGTYCNGLQEMIVPCTWHKGDRVSKEEQSTEFSFDDLKFSIFPNPLDNDILNFQLFTELTGEIPVKIINLQGQTVFESKVLIDKGENNLRLDLSGISQGTYIIGFEIDKKAHFIKLVKSN